jgi:hypothetical protein
MSLLCQDSVREPGSRGFAVNFVEVLGRFRRKPNPKSSMPNNAAMFAAPFDDGLVEIARLIDDTANHDEASSQRRPRS